MLEPITAGEAGISAGREAADEGGAWKGLWAGLSAAWGEISGGLIGTNLIGDAIQVYAREHVEDSAGVFKGQTECAGGGQEVGEEECGVHIGGGI